jgi:hypothetical protein
MQLKHVLLNTGLLVALVPTVDAGPLAYAVYQAGCASIVVPCYSAAGSIFGTVLVIAAPPAIAACNVGYGTCQAACASVLLAPTL